MDNKGEFRSLGTLTVQGKKITGLAIPYNSETYLGKDDQGRDIYEKIQPGALSEFLRNSPKIVAIKEHNPEYVLGSTADGTLRLEDTAEGLRYEIDPPEASYAADLLLAMQKNPKTYGASFHMRVEPSGRSWSRRSQGGYLRTIGKISQMREVTITAFPAYTDTTAYLRSQLETEALNALEQIDTGEAEAIVNLLEILKRI